MIAAQAGDSATYEKLLLELLPYVRRQLAGRVREPAEREDIVQNVLISLIQWENSGKPLRSRPSGEAKVSDSAPSRGPGGCIP